MARAGAAESSTTDQDPRTWTAGCRGRPCGRGRPDGPVTTWWSHTAVASHAGVHPARSSLAPCGWHSQTNEPHSIKRVCCTPGCAPADERCALDCRRACALDARDDCAVAQRTFVRQAASATSSLGCTAHPAMTIDGLVVVRATELAAVLRTGCPRDARHYESPGASHLVGQIGRAHV